MSNLSFPGSEDTIPLDEAVKLTTNWRDYIGKYEPASQYIRAFNIPMEDINELATFAKSPSVRAYLAMATPGDISTLKIILVPVDASGNDILSVPGLASDDQSTIYDFTTPCPQACDVNSPLF